jgi:hypothetical protein
MRVPFQPNHQFRFSFLRAFDKLIHSALAAVQWMRTFSLAITVSPVLLIDRLRLSLGGGVRGKPHYPSKEGLLAACLPQAKSMT